MSVDLLGYGSNAPNVITTRPADNRITGAVDTWGKDCSSPGAGDGTGILQGMINSWLAQFRGFIRGNGKTAALVDIITEDNADDLMMLKAMQHLIQRGQPSFGVDTGAANALVVALSPPLAEYKDGIQIRVMVANTTTGPATVNVNGLGVRAIVRQDGQPLQRNDLLAGAVVILTFAGGAWQLDMPAGFSRGAATVVSSATITLNLQNRAIGLKRTVGVAPMTINLPPNARNGHEVIIEDLVGNLQPAPATIVAPATEALVNTTQYVMDRNFQSTTFRLYDDGTTRIWSRST